MAVPVPGLIADSTTVDTPSTNPTATYPLQAHGGSDITYNTIYSGGGKITGLDPASTPTDVTGIPQNPFAPPIPQPLPRGVSGLGAAVPIVGIVNSAARGVYFEGTLVPVIGDGIVAPGAVPTPRPLTLPGKYPTIFIGTRT